MRDQDYLDCFEIDDWENILKLSSDASDPLSIMWKATAEFVYHKDPAKTENLMNTLDTSQLSEYERLRYYNLMARFEITTPQTSLQYLAKVKALLPNFPDHNYIFDHYYYMEYYATAMIGLGKSSDIFDVRLKVLDYLTKVNPPIFPYMLKALVLLGYVYLFGGNLDIAEVYFNRLAQELQSKELKQNIGTRYISFYADVYNGIGLIHERRGEADKALKSFNQSLEYNKKIDDMFNIAYNYMNIAWVTPLASRLPFLEMSLNAAEKVNHHEMNLILRAITQYYILTNDFETANRYLEKMELFIEKNPQLLQAKVRYWFTKGQYFANLPRLADKLKCVEYYMNVRKFGRGFDMIELIFSSFGLAHFLIIEFEAYPNDDILQQIEDCIRDIRELSIEALPIQEIDAIILLGKFYEVIGEYEKAREQYDEAVLLAKEKKTKEKYATRIINDFDANAFRMSQFASNQIRERIIKMNLQRYLVDAKKHIDQIRQ